MKHFSFALLLALFAGFSLVLSACGDSKKSDPTPQTGTLNGQITPAAAVTTVTATDAAGKSVTATPNSSGAYSFSGLAAGTYTLSFTPASGYSAPATQSVTITAGGTTTATPVTATTLGGSSSGSVSYTVNGTTNTANLISANALFGSLVINAISGSGSRSLSLSIGNFTNAAGTFTLGGTTAPSAITYTEIAGLTAPEWTTSAAGASGTITVTSVSANPRRISGTFNCVAQASSSSGASGTRTITAGTFTNLTY